MTWILLVALFVLLVRNQFEPQGVVKDIRRIAKSVRKIVRELARTIRQAVKEAKRETAEARKAVPEQAVPEQAGTAAVCETQHVQPETQQNNELLKELEQKAGTAAMLANVPTIAFPKDDPKYDSSRKYMYA